MTQHCHLTSLHTYTSAHSNQSTLFEYAKHAVGTAGNQTTQINQSGVGQRRAQEHVFDVTQPRTRISQT